MKTAKPLINLIRVSTRIRDRRILQDTSWTVEDGQSWAVIGPNGSGKTSLTRLLVRELPVISGTMNFRADFDPCRHIAMVSFETQKRILASENRKDESRYYCGNVLEFTRVRDFLQGSVVEKPDDGPDLQTMAGITAIGHLLERNITRLSTGEFRKVLIARAMLDRPKLLILDEPLEGLDHVSRVQLADFMNQLILEGVQVILVTHRLSVIPSAIGNIICLKDNRVLAQGERNSILHPDFIEKLYGQSRSATRQAIGDLFMPREKPPGSTLIRMDEVCVRYGDICVFERLSWQVMQGEKWLVTGANGSGKSTLLSLIAGDNPQAYANEIYLFGQRRGSGESIWDIKKRIGLVSSEFQLRYQKDMTVLDVVLSGFFDSVGLFRKPSPEQRSLALAWIAVLDLTEKALTFFTRLSFGEQKLVLIARAMVKSPDLLILDEPCQGLDPVNRRMVLDLIDILGRIPETTMIYVTHHSEETLVCIDRVLSMPPRHTR